MRGCERGKRRDAGFVTAEAAVVLPVLVAFAMALVWGLFVMAARIQCLDAARTGARAAARQDPADAVAAVTREAAPEGADVTVAREGDQVRVTVVARPPLLSGLPVEVREVAVAAAEETVGSGAVGDGALGTRAAGDETPGAGAVGDGTPGTRAAGDETPVAGAARDGAPEAGESGEGR